MQTEHTPEYKKYLTEFSSAEIAFNKNPNKKNRYNFK